MSENTEKLVFLILLFEWVDNTQKETVSILRNVSDYNDGKTTCAIM